MKIMAMNGRRGSMGALAAILSYIRVSRNWMHSQRLSAIIAESAQGMQKRCRAR